MIAARWLEPPIIRAPDRLLKLDLSRRIVHRRKLLRDVAELQGLVATRTGLRWGLLLALARLTINL